MENKASTTTLIPTTPEAPKKTLRQGIPCRVISSGWAGRGQSIATAMVIAEGTTTRHIRRIGGGWRDRQGNTYAVKE